MFSLFVPNVHVPIAQHIVSSQLRGALALLLSEHDDGLLHTRLDGSPAACLQHGEHFEPRRFPLGS